MHGDTCCGWDDPPLAGSAHALWEARWGITVEQRLAIKPDEFDAEIDEILAEVMAR